MNITNINIYAEAYYSGNTHEENIPIRTETYEKLKDSIDKIKCYIGELDGKHSEVEAETSITHFTKEEVSEESWDDVCDGERLYYKLEKYLKIMI